MKIQNTEMEFVAFASGDVIATSGMYVQMGGWLGAYMGGELLQSLTYDGNGVWSGNGQTFTLSGATGAVYDGIYIRDVENPFTLVDGKYYQLVKDSKLWTKNLPDGAISYLIGATEGNVGMDATGNFAAIMAYLGLDLQ